MEDYYKKVDVAIIRVNVGKDHETTIVRFLNGLNIKIANVIKL